MKKIIIVGSSGSGKTTLARRLSVILEIPHTELDAIHHQAHWQPMDNVEFAKQVNDIARGSEWIFCGNYFSTLGLGFWRQADTIIWCDYSLGRVFARLLRRTLRRTLTKERLWNGNYERFFVNFLTKDSVILWMLQSWKRQQRRYSEIFSQSSALPHTNLIRLRNPKDTELFVKQIRENVPIHKIEPLQ